MSSKYAPIRTVIIPFEYLSRHPKTGPPGFVEPTLYSARAPGPGTPVTRHANFVTSLVPWCSATMIGLLLVLLGVLGLEVARDTAP